MPTLAAITTPAPTPTTAGPDPVRVVSVAARNATVMANQGLVYQIAHRYEGRGLPLEDLVEEGNFGLMRAAEKFEPERGHKFSTYAVPWIRQAIDKAIGNTSRPIRIPLHTLRDAAIVHRRAREVAAETGRKPCLDEVLLEMEARGESCPEVRERLRDAAIAYGAKFGVKPLEEVARTTPPGESPLAGMIEAEHREQLWLAWELLPETHRQVLVWRYGLDGEPPRAYVAIRDLLGLTGWGAARRLEEKALEALRTLVNRTGNGSSSFNTRED